MKKTILTIATTGVLALIFSGCAESNYNAGNTSYNNNNNSVVSNANDGAPRSGSNERAYYDDGCKAGTSDGKASMSNVYERHAGAYDTRFEPYFKQGYEHCWPQYR